MSDLPIFDRVADAEIRKLQREYQRIIHENAKLKSLLTDAAMVLDEFGDEANHLRSKIEREVSK